MLPERLSNHICSLNPMEDKLTYSAVFELDAKANLISEWFGRTVIRSDRRSPMPEHNGIDTATAT
jgi:ribonuclease R